MYVHVLKTNIYILSSIAKIYVKFDKLFDKYLII